MIEVADYRGDHAVLPKQKSHSIERAAALLFEGDEFAHFVIAIGDVDPHVFIEDLIPPHAQFARVGMSDGQMVTARQKIAQH